MNQYTPNLGQLCGPDARRDAIHIAVAPVAAEHDLNPGQRVGLRDGQASVAVARHIGLVDPFLTSPVRAGEKFWLFLDPQTITGLRHVWEHPDFKARPPEVPREKPHG